MKLHLQKSFNSKSRAPPDNLHYFCRLRHTVQWKTSKDCQHNTLCHVFASYDIEFAIYVQGLIAQYLSICMKLKASGGVLQQIASVCRCLLIAEVVNL